MVLRPQRPAGGGSRYCPSAEKAKKENSMAEAVERWPREKEQGEK